MPHKRRPTSDPDDRDILAARAVHPQLQREYRFESTYLYGRRLYRLLARDLATDEWRSGGCLTDASHARDTIVFWSAKGWTLTAEPPTR